MASEMTRQEREAARYQAEIRFCGRCGGEYSGGSYGQHRDGEDHQRGLRVREALPALRALDPDSELSSELCSDLLGRGFPAMKAAQLLTALEVGVA